MNHGAANDYGGRLRLRYLRTPHSACRTVRDYGRWRPSGLGRWRMLRLYTPFKVQQHRHVDVAVTVKV